MNDEGPPGVPLQNPPTFDISPEVVFRLGDELITDELQALVELVKNSYDASATVVDVYIDTEALDDIDNDTQDEIETAEVSDASSEDLAARPPAEPTPKGWLEVRDDGDGMTRRQLDDGWLLISGSDKRAMKEKGQTNRLKRTPLGDKGLGRLGVLRLGNHVEIRTRPRAAAEEHILSFDRADFERKQALSAVPLGYERRLLVEDKSVLGGWRAEPPETPGLVGRPLVGRQGTVIRVTGLNNGEIWTDRVRVQQQMLSLISPFDDIDHFSLAVHLDDPEGKDPLQLGTLADLRRDLADLRWTFSFEDGRLVAAGRIKLKAFAPSASNERLSPFWSSHVEPDRGAEYRRRLAAGPLKPHTITQPGPPWWLGLELSIWLTDLGSESAGRTRRGKLQDRPSAWADPGPFCGELDSFSLGRDADLGTDEAAVFDSYELYSRWVRDVRGVKVFRDGFGIRVGDDFLGLGSAFTSGRSFWALRPGNVVGYVALSARDNAQLQETTDREGFVVNPAYRTFSALLRTLVDRINIVQTQIGRELTAWVDKSGTRVPQPPSRKATELARAAAARDTRTRETVAAVGAVQRTLTELGDGAALLTPAQAGEARKAGELLKRLRTLIAEGETLRHDLEELASASREVEQERAQLRDQLRVAYQTVGLGIVAETVAHEMTNITGRLQARADALSPQFKGPGHRAARALVSEIRSSIRAIRLQLRHLEPQLRYQRTRREVVDVLAAVQPVAEYHRGRLQSAGVAVDVGGTGFDARLNRGRLQQALDNLFINSEFWLDHARTEDPRIEIMVKSPLVTFRDNGPGVDPGLETAIFEPFVSGRTGDQGRGLGLFIARQVLNDDDASIYLGEPEPDGRRHEFMLDFSGAIPDPSDG